MSRIAQYHEINRPLAQIITLWVLIWAMSPSLLLAQSFSSGSNGSFGAINVPTNTTRTLDMPADGVFHATTIMVGTGATLSFTRNSLNTPVFLLATGDIVVQGSIVVSGSNGTTLNGGRGGPGGFDGGNASSGADPESDGFGPGAGLRPGGNATYGEKLLCGSSSLDGDIYGSSLLVPLVGGSGGAGRLGSGGGGGGGAVLLASSTLVQVSGTVMAVGGNTVVMPKRGLECNGIGSGSGGAIRIVAPLISGNGTLNVGAPSDPNDPRSHGGHGRIRLDTPNRAQVALNFTPVSAVSIGAVMQVFLSVNARIDIIEAAGQAIPVGTQQAVQIFLPPNTPTRQTVKVQAQGFTSTVPINVVVTPESGSRSVIPAEIPASGGNPAQVTVNVDIPMNVLTRINAWTRQE